MREEQTHINQIIRTAFEKMQSREDLLHLLNEVKPLIYGEKAVPFELKQLTWYANPKLSGKRYTEFKITKKSGAQRSIHSPIKGLKAIQKTLAYVLHCVYEPHKAAMGFVRDRSVVDNAKMHIGSKYVFNIDLKDFFPSIDQSRIWKCFQLKPFNLNDVSNDNENKEINLIHTSLRKFITENNEHIFYKINDDKITLIHDKKGDFFKYKNRLTSHLKKPRVSLTKNHKKAIEKLHKYEKDVIECIFNDAYRYILSDRNLDSIFKLTPSRLYLSGMIASICCTELDVERKNNVGEWIKVRRNVLPQGAPTSPIISNIVCQRLDFLFSGVAKRFGLIYSRYADDITFSSMHNVYQQDSDFTKELHRIIAEQGFHIKETKTRLQKDGYRKEVTGLLVNEKVNVQKRYIKQLRMWLYYWERYGYERASGFFLQQYILDNRNVKKVYPNMENVIAGKLDYLKMVKGADNDLYLGLKTRFDGLSGNSNFLDNILISWENKGIEEAMNIFYQKKVK